ncbi:MAG TPA: hypothetical protein VNY73_00290, partial [Bacteroidia bacterium]|nr:hypothetical protein [Bacteroidia bacterium]
MKKINPSQLKALFLLLVFVFDLLRPYVLTASGLNAASLSGDGPVAASASNYVDPFTGDFHYSVPLMVVPGPNGEAVDITAGYYSGGIKVDQAASWIGLGWDYNPGEISRSVMGSNDDNKGHPAVEIKTDVNITGPGSVSNTENFVFGPLYYKNSTSNSQKASYLSSYTNLTSSSFRQSKSNDVFSPWTDLPGYDNYSVSGPGISGKIKPYIFNINPSYYPHLYTPGAVFLPTPLSTDHHCGYTKPQFNFENSSDVSTSDFDTTSCRFKNGYYIKYYFNSEIASDLYSSSNKDGFLDYRIPPTGTRRPSSPSSSPYDTEFDPDGIGGYKITDPSGISYHYSLPVYSLEEYFYSFGFNSSSPALNGKVTLRKKPRKYATSWKLTAVTGPDYEDTDNNHMVNEGDKGYWVSYNYTLWCDNFLWASSQYNYSRDLHINGFADEGFGLLGAAPPTYGSTYNLSKGKKQVYYLNTIKTSTHTAFFIKDVRMDEHSYDNIQSGSNPVPLLKLSKIILLRNEDASLLTNTGSLTVDSRFDASNCNKNNDNFHIGKYNANSSQINLKSLKTIEFNTDYSLCHKYHKNINNTFSSTPFSVVTTTVSNVYADFVAVNNGHSLIFNYLTGCTPPSDLTTSGKLTLNEIKTYEAGKASIFPGYLFEYVDNADYDNLKVDFWGNYKSDFSSSLPSNYPTGGSVDAWSLYKITTPLGGIITVTYGNDNYSREARGDIKDIPVPFLITGVTTCSQAYTYALGLIFQNFSVPQGNDLASYMPGCNQVDLVLPVDAKCSSDSSNRFVHDHFIQENFACAMSSYTTNSGVINTTSTNSGGTYHYSGCSLLRPHLVSGKDNCFNTYPLTVNAHYNGGAGYFNVYLNTMPGGGIRVSSISVKDPQSSRSYATQYSYGSGYCRASPIPINYKKNPVTQVDYDLY